MSGLSPADEARIAASAAEHAALAPPLSDEIRQRLRALLTAGYAVARTDRRAAS